LLTAKKDALLSNSDSQTVEKLPDFFPALEPPIFDFALSNNLPNCALADNVPIMQMDNAKMDNFFIVK
jgi:hypothetical protein